jgi:maltodextrin utilization protein YvdJ
MVVVRMGQGLVVAVARRGRMVTLRDHREGLTALLMSDCFPSLQGSRYAFVRANMRYILNIRHRERQPSIVVARTR